MAKAQKEKSPEAQAPETPAVLRKVGAEFLPSATEMIAGKPFVINQDNGVTVEAKLVPHDESMTIHDQGKDVVYGPFDMVSTQNNGLVGNVKAMEATTFRVWTNDILGNLSRSRVKFADIQLAD